MTYVPLAGITPGQVGTSAWANGVERNLEALATNRPRVIVKATAGVSIPNTTATALLFNSERTDPYGMHSVASNTSQLVIPTGWDGLWMVNATVEFAAQATAVGKRELQLRVNASVNELDRDVKYMHSAWDGNAVPCSIGRPYIFAAADILELYVIQTSGGALNVSANSNYTPELSAVWLAP